MASKISLVNQVLSEIGSPPVNAITDSPQAQLISARLDIYLQELLLAYFWTWATKYRADDTPITQNFSPDFTYTYQLPSDYGRMFSLTNASLPYLFAGGYLLSNQRPITYYYIVNNADYEVLPILFQRVLSIYTASRVAAILTLKVELVEYLQKEYEIAFNNAIKQNDMERCVTQMPHNDFDRIRFV